MDKVSLKPINDMSVVQQVIDRLTNAMINKELRPGDKLPPEMELAAMLGVGRNSVREAIKVLTSFGVLETRRPEGTFVTNGSSDRMIEPLLYGIILDQTDSLNALKELRELIDLGILKLAIQKATKQDMELLSKRLLQLKEKLKTADVEAIFEADDNFHEAISEAAHNSLSAKIATLVRKLTSEIRLRTIRNMINLGKISEMERAHQVLFDMIKDKNSGNTGENRELVVDGYFYQYDILK
ncbi:MAG: FadR family transcriptional regulator [Selenomonadaceae bacterium]|nr:FadR family transcriptional regulator [Selenomonadaceae bacterium]MBR1859200.1 FadR family transcriptional regulator [Selenomonadaceae bacterium]